MPPGGAAARADRAAPLEASACPVRRPGGREFGDRALGRRGAFWNRRGRSEYSAGPGAPAECGGALPRGSPPRRAPDLHPHRGRVAAVSRHDPAGTFRVSEPAGAFVARYAMLAAAGASRVRQGAARGEGRPRAPAPGGSAPSVFSGRDRHMLSCRARIGLVQKLKLPAMPMGRTARARDRKTCGSPILMAGMNKKTEGQR